jgi:Hypothetical glycosyl hydrolase family 15
MAQSALHWEPEMRSSGRLTPEAARIVDRLHAAAAMSGRRTITSGAWLRYGKDALEPDEIEIAAERYRVAVLQPWELSALRALKRRRPDMVVLCYKCLSSTRSFETEGTFLTSGVSFTEAERAGESWFAHRRGTGDRIEWRDYPDHWQMAVWNPEYRRKWVANVVSEVATEPWDGVFADNDVFDDYYGLFPLAEVDAVADLRSGLDVLVGEAGEALNARDRLLVPNIAESRRERHRWTRHAQYGGGFEEHWLGWQPHIHFDEKTCLQQAVELHGPGIGVVRVNAGGDTVDRSFRYAVAAFWVLGAGRGWACTATAPDAYEGLPFRPEQSWDLGETVGRRRRRRGGLTQRFSAGWAAVNIGTTGVVTFHVPDGLVDAAGDPAPKKVRLQPKDGIVFASPSVLETAPAAAAAAASTAEHPLLVLARGPHRYPLDWFEMYGEARIDQEGRVRLPTRASYVDSVVSRPSFRASGRTARARLELTPGQPSSEAFLELRSSSGDFVAIGKSGDTLMLRSQHLGTRADHTLRFDPVKHRWWSLAVESQRVCWRTSQDGTVWHDERVLTGTEFGSVPVRMALHGGHYEPADADEEAIFGVVEVSS